MKFNLIKKDKHSNARMGLIKTAHGNIETPIFMPVGTLGTVKAVHNHELINDTLAQIILSNTYHLYLRPGLDIIRDAGGIHNFIGWNKPLLTDSGGYQVYSLSKTRKITEEGVKFQSHIDGSTHFFSPEKVIDIQRQIGADICTCLVPINTHNKRSPHKGYLLSQSPTRHLSAFCHFLGLGGSKTDTVFLLVKILYQHIFNNRSLKLLFCWPSVR